jgi:hypothetical protein
MGFTAFAYLHSTIGVFSIEIGAQLPQKHVHNCNEYSYTEVVHSRECFGAHFVGLKSGCEVDYSHRIKRVLYASPFDGCYPLALFMER